jgi:carbonic anhydrase
MDDSTPDPKLSRRGLLAAGTTAAAAAAVAAGGPAAELAFATQARPGTPTAALNALMNGNARYRRGNWKRRDYSPVGERRATAQEPFAAILTCADSRISPPLVFDVERGNLFAAHVAGNVVDEGTLASLEYAVAVLKVRLIMVLGHADCGAVKAAISVVAGETSFPPAQFGAIGSLIDRITPAITALPASNRSLARGTVANARAQRLALTKSEPIIAPALRRGDIRIVAAVYDIQSGRVVLA